MTAARWSDHSLSSERHMTFEEDVGAYDQKDAEGSIRLNALRLKLIATRNARVRTRAAQRGQICFNKGRKRGDFRRLD